MSAETYFCDRYRKKKKNKEEKKKKLKQKQKQNVKPGSLELLGHTSRASWIGITFFIWVAVKCAKKSSTPKKGKKKQKKTDTYLSQALQKWRHPLAAEMSEWSTSQNFFMATVDLRPACAVNGSVHSTAWGNV